MLRVIKLQNEQGLNAANRLLREIYALIFIWQGSAKGYFQDWIHDDLAPTLFILDY